MPTSLRAHRPRPDHPAAWRSGAVLAAAGAVAALTTHLSLRATSEGVTPSTPALAGATVALALLLWPLAARTTRVRSLAAVLALAQLGAHVVAGLMTGRPMSLTPAGLTCCPPGTQVRSGPLGTLTAQAGWALFAAQMLSCLLLAIAVHGSRRSLDALTAALALVREALRPWSVRRVFALWLTLRQIVTPAGPDVTVAPEAPEHVVRPGLASVRRRPRRGPPCPLNMRSVRFGTT